MLNPQAAPAAPSPAPRAAVEPLAPSRYKVQFTASAEFRDKLERLQALMRSSVPDGDLAKIIDLAVTEKLERLEARRFAKTKRPRKRLAQTDTRPKSRYIPAAVRRFVQKRDGGRCTYRDRHGRRCTKRHDLEFHHRKPFGRGGEHSPEVLCLMCKTHNLLLAEQDFGKEKMARYRRRANRDTKPVSVVGDGSGQGGLLARWRSSG
jgi:5-methylcytosine-specific restriction endonuclease McrA